jgi:hypothetical protein
MGWRRTGLRRTTTRADPHAWAFAIHDHLPSKRRRPRGAYATGVLVLITSAAVAVTLAARRARQQRLTVAFGVIALIFIYTTIANIIERPDGVKIAAIFIAAILTVSLLSRLTTEPSSSE